MKFYDDKKLPISSVYGMKIGARNDGVKQEIKTRIKRHKLSKELQVILDNIDRISFKTKLFELSPDRKTITFYFDYDYSNFVNVLQNLHYKKIFSTDDYYSVEVNIYDK